MLGQINNDPLVFGSLITLGFVVLLFLIYVSIKLRAFFKRNKRQ
jgi:hypothetical protein